MSTKRWLRFFATTLAAALAIGVAACGSSKRADPARIAAASASSSNSSQSRVVVRVGAVPITEATYQHWMAIGAATVEMPKPTGPLPKPLTYVPPSFTACIAQLRAATPTAPTNQLRRKCEKSYATIQNRILGFLITGAWLEQQAAAKRVSVTPAEVRQRLSVERRAQGAAAFRRLKEASRQDIADLEYAAERQLRSTKLLERFTAGHQSLPEAAVIADFNKALTSAWLPRTVCETGHVVKDCSEYKP